MVSWHTLAYYIYNVTLQGMHGVMYIQECTLVRPQITAVSEKRERKREREGREGREGERGREREREGEIGGRGSIEQSLWCLTAYESLLPFLRKWMSLQPSNITINRRNICVHSSSTQFHNNNTHIQDFHHCCKTHSTALCGYNAARLHTYVRKHKISMQKFSWAIIFGDFAETG